MLTELKPFLRLDRLPHIWCPGCGNGLVMAGIIRAIKRAGLNQDEVVIVSGIGCSARASGYLDFNTVHTTHGRALTFATGIKLAKPHLSVFVLMGDGDALAIGGNHFIHAARRNLDLNVIIFNNQIYGMTGGQASPMTPATSKATTAPYGQLEQPFDTVELAKGASATFVARSTAYHTQLTAKFIAEGIKHKGFAVTEVITQCPVAFGRRNGMGNPADMLKWQKERALNIDVAKNLGVKPEGKFLIGILHQEERPELGELIASQKARWQKGDN
ncbi:2-oxoacid:ferredoxin oxidoreductase subunit beta [Carboxydocella sp. ULO1]|uniref:2-oxoacid:ferredoxin oxidoreductase subunit beta n=1 Tax=Carboxydocella sp. ULO1 TaxID=1926599 RepID=UPI0009ADE348|nr:2-oxoacid:ferredoxin oxidoreductase subunit beta [Carboxydocella sp. ULO1]